MAISQPGSTTPDAFVRPETGADHALDEGAGTVSIFQLAGLGDQEIAQDLDLLGGFELFRIDEEDRQRGLDNSALRQHRHQIGFLFGHVVRDHADADAGQDGVLDGHD